MPIRSHSVCIFIKGPFSCVMSYVSTNLLIHKLQFGMSSMIRSTGTGLCFIKSKQHHAKMVLKPYMASVAPDQPAHLCPCNPLKYIEQDVISLSSRQCDSRSDCIYVQADLEPHCPHEGIRSIVAQRDSYVIKCHRHCEQANVLLSCIIINYRQFDTLGEDYFSYRPWIP